MLWKCCTQYTSKFGNLSSGHRTGKGPFSFHSQRKAMSKNVQATLQLCSFHMLAREWSKILQARLQQYLNQELPDVEDGFWGGRGSRGQHPLDHRKSKIIQEKKHFLLLHWLHQSLLLCGSLWKILNDMGIPIHLSSFLRNLYAGLEATVRTRHGTTDWL